MNLKKQIKALENLIRLYEIADDGYYISRLSKEHYQRLAYLKNELYQKSKKRTSK